MSMVLGKPLCVPEWGLPRVGPTHQEQDPLGCRPPPRIPATIAVRLASAHHAPTPIHPDARADSSVAPSAGRSRG